MRFNLDRDFNQLYKFFTLFFLFPLLLLAFEPQTITPYPVVGFREVSFHDDFQKVNRSLLIWYPVESQVVGIPSKSSLDVFDVAINAAPAHPQFKKPLIALSHGYLGDPHHL
jgi:hypothetical protein